MKKMFLVLILISSVCLCGFAGTRSETPEEGWSSLSYENIPVLKVMESREGYVIIYQKNKIGVGSTVIPKSWAKGNPDEPRKLKFRNLKSGIVKPYMTVIKKDGEFHRVILNLPTSKTNTVWGSLKEIKEGLDKTNLDDIKL